jgi:hypothetical protein
MIQTANSLGEGLKNHFALEEKHLPPILGDLLMQGLKLEHADIRKSLDGLQGTLSAIKLKESRSEQLLTSRWSIQQKLDDLRQLIEGHASREEVILHMAKRALGDKPGQSGS